jgi:two-component system, repressor protein LuxO
MQSVYRVIDSAAQSKASVFITGESGTGKEVCAEAIHRASSRASGPFIAINCSAIPKDLIESEVFGHVKGAFTGATANRKGAAQLADGGTLFLDEIGEMDINLQSKLLRFLQNRQVQPVGGSSAVDVDVRVICATNRDPLDEIAQGRFREDLFYRLHVLPIHLPSLQERDEDILEIGQHFLAKYSAEEGKAFTSFAPDVEARFLGFDWPGNVRQLQNVIRNIVVLHNSEFVDLTMLPAPLDTDKPTSSQIRTPASIVTPSVSTPASDTAQSRPHGGSRESIRKMADIEQEAIENALEVCEGSVPEAAHYLGISAATIYRKKASWKTQG